MYGKILVYHRIKQNVKVKVFYYSNYTPPSWIHFLFTTNLQWF